MPFSSAALRNRTSCLRMCSKPALLPLQRCAQSRMHRSYQGRRSRNVGMGNRSDLNAALKAVPGMWTVRAVFAGSGASRRLRTTQRSRADIQQATRRSLGTPRRTWLRTPCPDRAAHSACERLALQNMAQHIQQLKQKRWYVAADILRRNT
jgi:hypothetical protein